MRLGSGFVARVDLWFDVAAFGPTMFLGFWVYIRFCWCCRWRFRFYSESLWQTPQRNQRSLPQRSARSLGLGVPSLRDCSGRIASGLLRCTSSRCVWLCQTVAALPPPNQSLHSAFRRRPWIKIKSCSRACAHPVEWWKSMRSACVLCWIYPSPQPSPEGEGADF